MKSTPAFLVIDIGTTGTKLGFIDLGGAFLSTGYFDYPLETDKGGIVEQDPDLWWSGVCSATQQALAAADQPIDPIAIGLCGQMHTFVSLDERSKPLRKAIVWMDQRSESIVRQMRSDAKISERIRACTDNFAANTYTAPKLLWLQQNEPETSKQTRHIVLAKDYINLKLTGELASDYSNASGTLLYDTRRRGWSTEMLDLFGVATATMPDLIPSSEILGTLQKEPATQIGLPEGIPVIGGAADYTCHALGAGLFQPGDSSIQVGTSGSVTILTDRPVADPNKRIASWEYCLPETWASIGLTQTAGRSLNWIHSAMCRHMEPGSFFDEAERVAGFHQTSLIFLPYLNGERSPLWDADRRGVFWGVDINHTVNDFILAVMEGVCFSLQHNADSIQDIGVDCEQFVTLGGITHSPSWMKTLSGILSKPVLSSHADHTGLRGIAVLVALALNQYETAAEAVKVFSDSRTERVESKETRTASEKYSTYKWLASLTDAG